MNGPDSVKDLAQKLIDWFNPSEQYLAAFSGGVDSVTLAKGAIESGADTTGIFVGSPTSTADDLDQIDRIAQECGVALLKIKGDEMNDSQFLQNDSKRCYYCKKNRYEAMRNMAGSRILLDGSNADDLNDYRPGTAAVRELGIRSPLAELGINKNQVRTLARFWNLSVADKPSNPCLATRLAYGLQINKERLEMIDKGESFLRRNGFPVCRLRMDAPCSARIEVDPQELDRLVRQPLRSELIQYFQSLGFQFVSVDLEGFLSGKMNRSLHKSNLELF